MAVGRGGGELFRGYRVSGLQDDKVLETFHNSAMHFTLLSCHLKMVKIVNFVMCFTAIKEKSMIHARYDVEKPGKSYLFYLRPGLVFGSHEITY